MVVLFRASWSFSAAGAMYFVWKAPATARANLQQQQASTQQWLKLSEAAADTTAVGGCTPAAVRQRQA